VAAVAEGEIEEMGKKSTSLRKVTGRLFKKKDVEWNYILT
jgi:predicted sugar kinase